MIKEFIKRVIKFFGYFCLIVFPSWVLINYNKIDLPAPNLSNSYSVNEKLLFIRKNIDSAEVLAVGSSMTLNNLHSQTIADYYQTSHFLNTAVWGLVISSNYEYIKILDDIYHPKDIIIYLNLSDFVERDHNLRMEQWKAYLTKKGSGLQYHLTTFNFPYYIKNSKYAKHVRTDKNSYEYLGYDQFGGANIDSAGFIRNENR